MQTLIDSGIARNAISNVRLHRFALGSECGELTLSVPRGHAGSASFVKGRHFNESDEIRGPVRTLSEAMMQQDVHKIRLVKIDVEGSSHKYWQARGLLLTDATPIPSCSS